MKLARVYIPNISGISYLNVPEKFKDPHNLLPMIYPVILEPTKTVVDKSTAIQIMICDKKDVITGEPVTHFVPYLELKERLDFFYETVEVKMLNAFDPKLGCNNLRYK